MIQQITLTGVRKIMNMAKLGIVSRSLKIQESPATARKHRGFGLMRYTLCEFLVGSARRKFAVCQRSPLNALQQMRNQRLELGWPYWFVQQMVSAHACEFQYRWAGVTTN